MIAKRVDGPYVPGERDMLKVKLLRTADCVVAGFRWHKSGPDAVGSLLLGLYDDNGVLQHVGVTSSFTMAKRRQLVEELAPLRKNYVVWLEDVKPPGSVCGWSTCTRAAGPR